uniref:Uncharacterized protein n=1 Tax=Glossina pallidipes TaxID=7398 RepID=A0A1A9ZV73_GLOPL
MYTGLIVWWYGGDGGGGDGRSGNGLVEYLDDSASTLQADADEDDDNEKKTIRCELVAIFHKIAQNYSDELAAWLWLNGDAIVVAVVVIFVAHVDVTRTYNANDREKEDGLAARCHCCCCCRCRSCHNCCIHANGVNPQCNVQHNMSNNVKA